MPPLLAGENFEIRYINVGLSWLQRTRRICSHSPSTACTSRRRHRRRLLLLLHCTKNFTPTITYFFRWDTMRNNCVKAI